MKKEMFISVVVGLVFGLIITYGVYTARTSLSGSGASTEIVASPSPSPELETHGQLTVISPADETIQAESSITVTGTAPADALVVIFANNDEYIRSADSTGNFSVEVDLEAGSNIIAVHLISEDGQSTVVERTVIVSDAPLTDEAQTASSSAQTEEKNDN